MYEVVIEGIKDCNCYKKRGETLPQKFESAFGAKTKALEIIEHMNDTFCGVHHFLLKEEDKKFIIVAKRVI